MVVILTLVKGAEANSLTGRSISNSYNPVDHITTVLDPNFQIPHNNGVIAIKPYNRGSKMYIQNWFLYSIWIKVIRMVQFYVDCCVQTTPSSGNPLPQSWVNKLR